PAPAPTPGRVSAQRCLATDHRPVGFPTAAPAHGWTPAATPARRLCAALLRRSGRKLGEGPGWGVLSAFAEPGASSRLSAPSRRIRGPGSYPPGREPGRAPFV